MAMTEWDKRMVMLGRQAPPQSNTSLSLPVHETYSVECNKSISLVNARVQRHFPFENYLVDPEEDMRRKQEKLEQQATKDRVVLSFRRKVRQRAASTHKDLMMQKLSTVKELEVKKSKLDRIKAYNKMVSERNSQLLRDANSASSQEQHQQHLAADQLERPAITTSSRVHAAALAGINIGGVGSSPNKPSVVCHVSKVTTSPQVEAVCLHEASGNEQASTQVGGLQQNLMHLQATCTPDATKDEAEGQGMLGSTSSRQSQNGQLSPPTIAAAPSSTPSPALSTPLCRTPPPASTVPASPSTLDKQDRIVQAARNRLAAHYKQTPSSSFVDLSDLSISDQQPSEGNMAHTAMWAPPHPGLPSVVAPRTVRILRASAGQGSQQARTSQPDAMYASSKHRNESSVRASLSGSIQTSVTKQPCSGLNSICTKVQELQLKVPALCNCNRAEAWDAKYTEYCCNNCPLFRNASLHYQLLRSAVQSMGAQ